MAAFSVVFIIVLFLKVKELGLVCALPERVSNSNKFEKMDFMCLDFMVKLMAQR